MTIFMLKFEQHKYRVFIVKFIRKIKRILSPEDLTKVNITKNMLLFTIHVIISLVFQQIYTLINVIIADQNYGTKEFKRIKEGIKKSLIVSVSTSILLIIITLLLCINKTFLKVFLSLLKINNLTIKYRTYYCYTNSLFLSWYFIY